MKQHTNITIKAIFFMLTLSAVSAVQARDSLASLRADLNAISTTLETLQMQVDQNPATQFIPVRIESGNEYEVSPNTQIEINASCPSATMLIAGACSSENPSLSLHSNKPDMQNNLWQCSWINTTTEVLASKISAYATCVVVDQLLWNSDTDGDSYTPAEGDCDDNNPLIFPGAIEVGDGVDNNCNDLIDEDTQIEFSANGQFIVPDGITSIQVELWGAGGGGGDGGDNNSSFCFQRLESGGGGGGGSGGYSNQTFNVTPGASYSVSIGSGGVAGFGSLGSSGSSTSFGSLLDTGGGQGGGLGRGIVLGGTFGTSCRGNFDTGFGGAGGLGNNGVGLTGSNGTTCNGGVGGNSTFGKGGNGGTGEGISCSGPSATHGSSGHATISW